jgi:hypothetical protein
MVQLFESSSSITLTNKKNIVEKKTTPKDHFVYINTHLKLVNKTKEECNDNCVLISDVSTNVNEINKLFIDTPVLVGSGFVIEHNKNKSKVMTADHVCQDLIKYTSKENIFIKSKFQILKAIGAKKHFSYLDVAQISANYKIKSVITLFDFNGNTYPDIEILKQNKDKDLCLIGSNYTIGKPAVLSKNNCVYGEELINVSASDGVYFPKVVPYNVGYYSGDLKNHKFSIYGEKEEVALYTIDIEKGASGSGVFSKKTKKLCGTISASMKASGTSIGNTNNSVKEFINQ